LPDRSLTVVARFEDVRDPRHNETGTMTVEADERRGDAYYNEFYRSGGWRYRRLREARWHRRNILRPFGLARGMRLLEIACGNGFHTDMLRRMGFDCVGVDRSTEGIRWAREHHPRSTYVCCDFREMPFPPGSFDAVLARGCSHYHYDLLGPKALESTSTVLRYIKPGGAFVMTIVTDLSGRRDPDHIWQNTLEDYERHFASFERPYSVRWEKGQVICGLWQRDPAARDA
jgi:SAM-dependent methyltransferase